MTVTLPVDSVPYAPVPQNTTNFAHELMARAEQITPGNVRKYIAGIPLKAKLAIRTALHLPKGSLTIQFPDNRIVKIDGKEAGPNAVLILKNWNLPRRALTSATVGVGESYMDDDWDSPDVTEFLRLFVVNEEWCYSMARASAVFNAFNKVRHWLNRNTKIKAQKNISAHYDLGNDFYAKWLDPSMTYSSALYQTGANSLEAAQEAKYRALAEALGIKSSDHVLEIGCGWGGFAEFAASEIGCKVTGLTISREQLEYARKRIKKAGLEDKVDLRFQDYRDEKKQYDHVVSIEMFEAVGEEYWGTYFDKVHDVLKPGGKAGLQIISIEEDSFPIYRDNPDFIQRHIFPGGMLPPPSLLGNNPAGSALEFVSENLFSRDYARTLAEWRERFSASWGDLQKMGFDERFKRMWDFYLYYCEAGFAEEFIHVRQSVFRRPA